LTATTELELDEAAEFEKLYREASAGLVWYDDAMDHQWSGALFGTASPRWILGDEMGLGKTLTSIMWLDLIGAKKVVIVCEAGVVEQFAGEVMRWAPHRTAYVLAKKRPQARAEIMREVWLKREAVILVNYEIWRKDHALLESMVRWQPDTVIVDEAHNIKSTRTSNYDYVSALITLDNKCPKCGTAMFGLLMPKVPGESRRKPAHCPGCGWDRTQPRKNTDGRWAYWQNTRSVQNVLFMTGTPILNTPTDLYPMLHLIDPLMFPEKKQFEQNYTITDFTGKRVFLKGGAARIRELMAPFYIARSREDAGITLPEQRVHIMAMDLDRQTYPKQYRVIQQVSKAATIMLESGQSATLMHLLSIITRKRQANVWPGGIRIEDGLGNVILDVSTEIQESQKLDEILDAVEVLQAEGRRQIIFSQFKSALVEMERRMHQRGIRAVRLDGDTSKTTRQAIRDDFAAGVEHPRWDVVLANYRTGGTGLNLTGANVTHILDEEWNPGKRDQAYARTNRIGQVRDSDVYVWRLRATIDTWMAGIIAHKEKQLQLFEGEYREDFGQMARDLTEKMKSGEVA